MAILSISLCLLFSALFLYLVLPPGEDLARALEDSFTIKRIAISGLVLNAAAATHVIYFFYNLGDRDRIWLLNIFVGWSLILGGGIGLFFRFEFDFSLEGLGSLSVGSQTLNNAWTLVIGAILTSFSSWRYRQEQGARD